MTATVHQLRCQEIAARVATRDQEATADLILDIALRAAVEVYRNPQTTPDYKRARAALLLEQAGASADRILGRTTR